MAEAEVKHGQACLPLAAAPGGRPREVDTPWGRLSFEEDVMALDHVGSRETADVEVETALGPAMLSLHVEIGRHGPEGHVVASVCAGTARWAQPVGKPISRDGRNVAWSFPVRLDLGNSRPVRLDDQGVWLTDADAPRESWRHGLLPPSVEDPVLVADVEAAVTDLLEKAAAADSGYASRAYATMMEDAARQAGEEAEAARQAYVRACHARKRMEASAHAAETLGRGGKADVLGYPDEPDLDLGEIRGFASDSPAYDPQDVDEIVVWAPEMVHLETMSDDHVWIGIYLPDGRRITANLGVAKRRLVVAADVED